MPMVEEERRSPRRLDASMSLLSDIAADSLDPDYRRAAELRWKARGTSGASGASGASGGGGTDTGDDRPARELGGRERPRWVGSIALGLGLLAIGLLVSVAAERVQANESIVSGEREALVERIGEADAESEALQDAIADLEGDIRALESDQLDSSAAGGLLNEELTSLRSMVGTQRVVGPGIIVTLDDAPQDWPDRDPETSDVLDVDIQQVVNALWQSGAEAIAVNGQRITPTTAVRSANDLIQVKYRPLSPPYYVTAVGDDQELVSRFDRGPGGQWLRAVKADGVQSSVEVAEDDLALPAGNAPMSNAVPEEAP